MKARLGALYDSLICLVRCCAQYSDKGKFKSGENICIHACNVK